MAPTSFYARSVGVLTMIWGIFFALIAVILYTLAEQGADIEVVGLAFSPMIFAVLIALLFLFLQFLISPFIMDLQLRWIYDMSWVQANQLPQDMYDALMHLFDKHNFSTTKIGIIHDNMPNAFVYGHFKNNARIVVTEGIINLLEPEERVAVLTHEIGHIVHLDFVFMTVAQALPLLMYYLYITSRSFGEVMSRTSSNNNKNPAPVLYAVAAASYIVYWISTYIVLLLSRYRESYADAFAARESGTPNAMSSALVKVAYGLVVADSETAKELSNDDLDSDRRRTLRKKQGYSTAIRTMGLADVNTAKGLVMQAYGKGGDGVKAEVSPEAVAAAAAWDLQTPWAKFLELNSTHPLTGKRLKHIDDIAVDMGQKRKYPSLGAVKIPESLLDEFIMDIFLQYILPMGIIVFPVVFGVITLVSGQSFLLGVGLGLLVFAVVWLYRVAIKYPSLDHIDNPNVQKNTVLEALTSMERDGFYEASPVRGKPIILEGKVMGKGTPGFYLSEDFVIQDETGFMVVDYQSIVPLYGLWFGWKWVNKLMGERVRVLGWYQRGIMPRLRMWKLLMPDGNVKKNRWRGANRIFAFIVGIIGLGLALSSLGFV